MCVGELIVGGVADGFGVTWVWFLELRVLSLGGVREGSEWVFSWVLEYEANSLESLLGRCGCYGTCVWIA